MNLNLSTLLDVAISLIFVFFVLSMFVSGLVEFINAFAEQRSKLLRLALSKILDDQAFNDFFNHQLVEVKRQKYAGFLKPISYLSADSFSTVLIDLLVKVSGTSPTSTLATLTAIRTAIADPKMVRIRALIEPMLNKSDTFPTFKRELEAWYNGYMEQVSGWFKRYAQGLIWVVAAVVTLVFNVDSVKLTSRLFNDKDLRARLVAQAERVVSDSTRFTKNDTTFVDYLTKQNPGLLDTTQRPPVIRSKLNALDSLKLQANYVQFVREEISVLALPLGWNPKERLNAWSVPGWLITIAALSFGAPFWFDLLLKLVNIRNAPRRPNSR